MKLWLEKIGWEKYCPIAAELVAGKRVPTREAHILANQEIVEFCNSKQLDSDSIDALLKFMRERFPGMY